MAASSAAGLPGGSVYKETACSAGEAGSIPASERSPGEGNGNSLQYSCLESPLVRGAWQAIVHEVAIVEHDLATKPLLARVSDGSLIQLLGNKNSVNRRPQLLEKTKKPVKRT